MVWTELLGSHIEVHLPKLSINFSATFNTSLQSSAVYTAEQRNTSWVVYHQGDHRGEHLDLEHLLQLGLKFRGLEKIIMKQSCGAEWVSDMHDKFLRLYVLTTLMKYLFDAIHQSALFRSNSWQPITKWRPKSDGLMATTNIDTRRGVNCKARIRTGICRGWIRNMGFKRIIKANTVNISNSTALNTLINIGHSR